LTIHIPLKTSQTLLGSSYSHKKRESNDRGYFVLFRDYRRGNFYGDGSRYSRKKDFVYKRITSTFKKPERGAFVIKTPNRKSSSRYVYLLFASFDWRDDSGSKLGHKKSLTRRGENGKFKGYSFICARVLSCIISRMDDRPWIWF
jgi:hypothetical protein